MLLRSRMLKYKAIQTCNIWSHDFGNTREPNYKNTYIFFKRGWCVDSLVEVFKTMFVQAGGRTNGAVWYPRHAKNFFRDFQEFSLSFAQNHLTLTHLDLIKMDNIIVDTILKYIPLMRIVPFAFICHWGICHWGLILRVPLTINDHRYRYWLAC